MFFWSSCFVIICNEKSEELVGFNLDFLSSYDADQNKDKKSFKGPGVLICSIDNMPTQLPREATDFFGDLLIPHIPDILKSDASKPFEENKVQNRVARWLL